MKVVVVLLLILLFEMFVFPVAPVAAVGHHPCLNPGDEGVCRTWTAEVRGERFAGSLEDRSPTQPFDLEREIRIEAAYAYHAAHMADHPTEFRVGTNGSDGFDVGIRSVHPADVTVLSVEGP
jgi:hypothetical protein